MPGKLRWGILGTGMIARKFAADLPSSRTGVLVATGSRSPEAAGEFAKQYGGRGRAGYEAVLADPEVDAIYISLPNGLHAEWAIRASEAGKHVLCEKPIARHAVEAESMFATAQARGRVLVEAFMYRATPLIRRLIETVRSGAIGDLRLIRANFTFEREVSLADARYQVAHAGGSLMDVGCYCVHFCRALTGLEPSESHAVAHLHSSGVDDYAAGVLKFGDDVLATLTCGMTVKSDTGAYIAGTGGMIEIDAFWFGQRGFTLIRNGHTERIEEPLTAPIYALEADAFAAVVRGENPPWITPEDSIANLRVLDSLRQSCGVPLY